MQINYWRNRKFLGKPVRYRTRMRTGSPGDRTWACDSVSPSARQVPARGRRDRVRGPPRPRPTPPPPHPNAGRWQTWRGYKPPTPPASTTRLLPRSHPRPPANHDPGSCTAPLTRVAHSADVSSRSHSSHAHNPPPNPRASRPPTHPRWEISREEWPPCREKQLQLPRPPLPSPPRAAR